ncbi:MAG: hypothetical protein M0C28_04825 [Candidatus Moduliflexus flocculans]|nr:hypothetical protein [Candidatus Moduliflexus flocculans]
MVIAEGTFRRTVDLGAAGKILEVSIPVVPEQFRGGPLLDVNGQLVGMLLVLDRGLKVGIPIATLVSRAPDGQGRRVQGPGPRRTTSRRSKGTYSPAGRPWPSTSR